MTDESRPGGPVLTVRGEATLEVQPEFARLAITVTALDAQRDRVVERLAQRNEECLDLLRSYGDAVEKIESAGFTIHPEFKGWERGENPSKHRGTVRIDVTITDFTALGDLVARVGEGEMTSIDGPWWQVRRDSPARRRVRQEAARDAVLRAHEYADALGARVTGLLELADESPAAVRHGFATPASLGADQRPVITLEPQLQTLQAQVVARFTISVPDRL